MKEITILIPAYNEEDVLYQLYNRLIGVVKTLPLYKFEFLFINDGSKDNTLQMIISLAEVDNKISYVSLSRNFGKETAMLAGLDYAQGDAVVIIDADLQDPPELIPEMIKYWEDGYDDIYAKRKTRSGETWLKRSTAKTFYKLLKRVARVPIQENTGDFRLLDRRCIEALKQLREMHRYTKGMFSWIGYNKKEILFDRDPRAAGETKWNYMKLMDLAIEGITSFTIVPLRMSSLLGVAISILAFIYMLWIITKTLIFGDPATGYPSLMTVVLFLGGIQLFSLGVIGEYLGKVFNETKRRPLYFVDVYNGMKIDNKENRESQSEKIFRDKEEITEKRVKVI